MPYDPKDLNELGLALAKVANSVKASLDDDGSLTIGDAVNFIDDVIPLYNGIVGIQNIPVNIGEITEEQKATFKQGVLDELNFDPADENAVDKLLSWVFSTSDVLVALGIIPSGTAGAGETLSSDDSVSPDITIDTGEGTTEEDSGPSDASDGGPAEG